MTRTQDFRTLSVHVLPERPHLDHLRREAKHRHAALKALSHSARLSDAQLVVARSYGFTSWMALKIEVDRRRLLCGAIETPALTLRPLGDERRYPRHSRFVNPAAAEQALFPAALMGMVVVEFSGLIGAILHALLG